MQAISSTSGPLRHGAATQRVLCVLLAVLVLILGVALFSPLHTHSTAKKGGCSFNNLEHQFIALASAIAVLLILLESTWREPSALAELAFVFHPTLRLGRAPPLSF